MSLRRPDSGRAVVDVTCPECWETVAGSGGLVLTVFGALAVGHKVYRTRHTGVSAAGLGDHDTEVIPPRGDRPHPWTRRRNRVRAARGGRDR